MPNKNLSKLILSVLNNPQNKKWLLAFETQHPIGDYRTSPLLCEIVRQYGRNYAQYFGDLKLNSTQKSVCIKLDNRKLLIHSEAIKRAFECDLKTAEKIRCASTIDSLKTIMLKMV